MRGRKRSTKTETGQIKAEFADLRLMVHVHTVCMWQVFQNAHSENPTSLLDVDMEE